MKKKLEHQSQIESEPDYRKIIFFYKFKSEKE